MSNPFDLHRDALALIGAASNCDDVGVRSVLENVDASDAGEFIAALAGLVSHAFATPPEIGFSKFLAAMTEAVDLSEAQAQGRA